MSQIICVWSRKKDGARAYHHAYVDQREEDLRRARRVDKAEADRWLDQCNDYWVGFVEPAPFDQEEDLRIGSYTFRCYLYKRFVLRMEYNEACVTPLTDEDIPIKEQVS